MNSPRPEICILKAFHCSDTQGAGCGEQKLTMAKKQMTREGTVLVIESTRYPYTQDELGEGSMKQNTAVWFTSQRSRIAQRDPERYVRESFAHPGKMLPDIINCILDTYGRKGHVWLDPMCGIGTTVIEALDRGYDAYGVEWEPRWYAVCEENLSLAVKRRAPGAARFFQGDARHLSQILGNTLFDRIAFSPPYGNTLSRTSHGPDKYPDKQQGGKRSARAIRHGYGFEGTEEAAIPDAPGEMAMKVGDNQANIGDLKHGEIHEAVSLASALANHEKGLPEVRASYLTEMAKVYHECYEVLRPGGMMILVLRDYRRAKKRVDLLGDTLDICETLGFHYHDRIAALQCPVSGDGPNIAARPEGALAFWTIENCKKSIPPVMIPTFEDVLVLTKPTSSSKEKRR